MNAPTISIQNIHLSFKDKILFENLNLTLRAGRTTCLLGPSGVGKTSLLRIIAQLLMGDTHWRGQVTCDNGIPIAEQIAYMAQTDLLLPWLTVLENALLYNKLHAAVTEKNKLKAHRLLTQLGLEKSINQYPHELSGGMRQRVALARTWLQDKPVILMDEPFSNLDAITRMQLQSLSAEFLKDRTVLLITHDPVEALRLADDLYIMAGEPGQLYPFTLTDTPLRDPLHPEFIKHQAELMRALVEAKALCL